MNRIIYYLILALLALNLKKSQEEDLSKSTLMTQRTKEEEMDEVEEVTMNNRNEHITNNSWDTGESDYPRRSFYNEDDVAIERTTRSNYDIYEKVNPIEIEEEEIRDQTEKIPGKQGEEVEEKEAIWPEDGEDMEGREEQDIPEQVEEAEDGVKGEEEKDTVGETLPEEGEVVGEKEEQDIPEQVEEAEDGVKGEEEKDTVGEILLEEGEVVGEKEEKDIPEQVEEAEDGVKGEEEKDTAGKNLPEEGEANKEKDKIDESPVNESENNNGFMESIKNGIGWTLQQDEVVEEDLYLALKIGEVLNLNGHTLEIKGDFNQVQGQVKVNGGKLIIGGNYYMDNHQEGTWGSGRLFLQHPNDYVYVEGNMEMYTSWNVKDYWLDGTLHLKGNLQCRPLQEKAIFTVSAKSHLEIILEGTEHQSITILCGNVRLPQVRIQGQAGRQIEIQAECNKNIKKEMTIQGITSDVETSLKLDKEMSIERLEMNQPVVVQSNCTVRHVLLNGNRLLVEGDLKLKDSLTFNKGQVYVNGSMEWLTVTKINMKEVEDHLEIQGDLSMVGCGEMHLHTGKLIVGGNIDQTGLYPFVTEETLDVILLGNRGENVTIIGENMILNHVHLVNTQTSYQFSQGVIYKIDSSSC